MGRFCRIVILLPHVIPDHNGCRLHTVLDTRIRHAPWKAFVRAMSMPGKWLVHSMTCVMASLS